MSALNMFVSFGADSRFVHVFFAGVAAAINASNNFPGDGFQAGPSQRTIRRISSRYEQSTFSPSMLVCIPNALFPVQGSDSGGTFFIVRSQM